MVPAATYGDKKIAFLDVFCLVMAGPSSLGSACILISPSFTLTDFFSSSLPLIFVSGLLSFHSIPSILFSFKFGMSSFNCYFLILINL
jgi:hypothetical protein